MGERSVSGAPSQISSIRSDLIPSDSPLPVSKVVELVCHPETVRVIHQVGSGMKSATERIDTILGNIEASVVLWAEPLAGGKMLCAAQCFLSRRYHVGL